MALHPKLKQYRKAKHAKVLSRTLKKIEKDLVNLGTLVFDAEIVPLDDQRSLLRRWFEPGYGEAEEALFATTQYHDCDVEIFVPMGKGGIAPPYMMNITIPVPMEGRVEYRHGGFGAKWHVIPQDKDHKANLKRVMPKAKMKQQQVSKKIPVYCDYKIEVGHSLTSEDKSSTTWIVHTGYQSGRVISGARPRVTKFLKALPQIKAMLASWASKSKAADHHEEDYPHSLTG